MIHFFPTFSKTADDGPFGDELRRQGVAYRIFASSIRIRFRNRAMILLVAYPRLAWFALVSAFRSMALSRPRPGAVSVGSDVEVLMFALVRLLLPGRGPRIALQGFIFTARRSSVLNRLRRLYFGAVLARCHCIICHPQLEVARYARLFPRSAAHFAFVPWGGTVNGRDVPAPAEPPHAMRIPAAGRSGRDYVTLVRALPASAELTLVCDNNDALAGVGESEQVRILRQCYDADYAAELRRADVVAVPLAVDDISAGQMVMIQAMAYGKPVVVTRTPTVSEYIADGVEGLLVDGGDAEDLRRALVRLRDDPALRARLGAGASAAYEGRFSQTAYIGNIVATIQRQCGIPAAAAA